MFILEFKVASQVITWENPGRIPVENTRGYLFARFDTDSEWSGMAKTAVFQTGARPPVMVSVTDELVKVPAECLVRGQMAVGLIGLDESGTVRLVTRQMRRGIPLEPSAPVDGMPPEETTPALWEQVLASIGDLNALKTLDKSSLVAAINEAAQTGGGGGGGISFTLDNTLKLQDGVLGVNTTDEPEQDNTQPITSAAVYNTIGNINALLATI